MTSEIPVFQHIRLLSALAALFHDVGKANRYFQRKLKSRSRKIAPDPYRHEWVSLRLFEAFVGTDSDEAWLARLAALSGATAGDWRARMVSDDPTKPARSPLSNLPPLAQAVAWLIVSHHRLPAHPTRKVHQLVGRELPRAEDQITADWCGPYPATPADRAECWSFPETGPRDPLDSRHWQRRARRLAQAILARPGLVTAPWLDNPFVLTLSRLSLILADHAYSSLLSDGRRGATTFPLYANTLTPGVLKQRLDAHLTGVSLNASRITRALPGLTRHLPSLSDHSPAFERAAGSEAFAWQDDAFTLARSLRDLAADRGFFAVNMASTGCGKTLSNARILYAIARPGAGPRFTAALGLRTLTLQTGDAYRERLGLAPADLAVLVGDAAVQALHEQEQEPAAGPDGLLDPDTYVVGPHCPPGGPLNPWLADPRRSDDAQRLLNAPVVVCTIDHLMPATERVRGGRHILPQLRLLSSDLVLDEPDDFGLEDLPALTRLVYLAGLLGSRVILSSATLPPALVEGLFRAYREGRRRFDLAHGVALPLPIPCAWIDEFEASAQQIPDQDGLEAFAQEHGRFVARRVEALAQVPPRRIVALYAAPTPRNPSRQAVCEALAESLNMQVPHLHAQNCTRDLRTGQSVSFGLVRLANIGPLVATAKALLALGAPEGYHLHLCVYHSQHPLLVRSNIERTLDRALNRKDCDPAAILRTPLVRDALALHPEQHHVFLVLATPVAEVGRDHDYDWAIVEPSSMRSLIQILGRVRRHREGAATTPNVNILMSNLRALEGQSPAYCRPGYESKEWPLASYALSDLLAPEQLARGDAAARIQERPALHPRHNLVDLEHRRLRALMTDGVGNDPHRCWSTRAMLTGELQRADPFRWDPDGTLRYALLPSDDRSGAVDFFRVEGDGTGSTRLTNLVNGGDLSPALREGPRVSFWAVPDYREALATLAAERHMDLLPCARQFGYLDLAPPRGSRSQGWAYHPALGFSALL